MGAIKQIKCESCGKSWECRTGCGIMHGRLETVLNLFPKEIQEDVKKKTMQEIFPRFHFSFEMLCCDTCRAVVSVPVFELPDKALRYVGVCPICHGKTQGIENKSIPKMKSPGELQCPACQSKALHIQRIGIWD